MTVTFLTLTAADKDASAREEWVLTADLLQPGRKASRSGWTWFSATSTQLGLFVLSPEVLTGFLPPDHRVRPPLHTCMTFMSGNSHERHLCRSGSAP